MRGYRGGGWETIAVFVLVAVRLGVAKLEMLLRESLAPVLAPQLVDETRLAPRELVAPLEPTNPGRFPYVLRYITSTKTTVKHDYQNGHLEASSAYKALLGLSNLQNLLLAGWTTIRVMGDADVFYAVQDLKRIIDEGVFSGPRLTGAAHYISITGGGGDINYLFL